MSKRTSPTEFDEDFHDEPAELGTRPAGRHLVFEMLSRWYWIALGLCLGGILSVYYLSKAPKVFASSATLLVKQQTSGVLTSEGPQDIDMKSTEAMNTVAERLKRRSLLEKVAARDDVRALEGLIPPPVNWMPAWLGENAGGAAAAHGPSSAESMDTKALAGFIGSKMSVNIRRGTRLLDISFTHPTPEVARVLADAVAMEYIGEISQNRSSGRVASIELLSEKSDQARASLQKAQNAHSSYLRALESHKELEDKEKEYAELGRRYLPRHPKMVACVGQIDALQSRFLSDFDASVKSGADQAYWEQSGEKWNPDSQSLDQRLSIARRTLLARTAVLKSEIDSQELVFNAILTKMGETDVNQAATESEIEISSAASLPGGPVSPVVPKVVMAGLAGGGALGMLLAFGAVRLDNKFHQVPEIEASTQVPVFGAVSQLPQRALARLLEEGKTKENGCCDDWSSAIVFRPAVEDTTFAEMFRVLRASVSLLGPEEKRKVTLFTSAIPGEGKTFCSVNFALASANQGRRVLLIDMDLRKPSVHKLFGIDRDSSPIGTHGYLAGTGTLDQAILPEQLVPNLDVMLAGPLPVNPGSLVFRKEAMSRIFAEVTEKYDAVIIDTSPLLAVPDARMIARFADTICLVARANYTPRNAVRRAIEILQAGHTPASGIVFNGFRMARVRHGYHYSYGQYAYGTGSYGTYGSEKE